MDGKRWLVGLVIALLFFGAGCARRGAVDESSQVQVELVEVRPEPIQVGEAELVLRMMDREGRPVEAAQVQVKGDMSHAGMVPVLGEAQEQGGGLYTVPFEWTMAGDWILTVSGTLQAGGHFEDQIQVVVASGE
jgi:hypothetical protein